MLTVEADVDDGTVPMILLENTLSGSVSDWSGRMQLDATTTLQVSYYNEAFSVWEPVIEPVQKQETGQWAPWELTASVRTHSEEELSDPKNPHSQSLPKMTVDVLSKDMMNITITKSFLQLTKHLGEAFEKAAKQIAPPKRRELPGMFKFYAHFSLTLGSAGYLILNETGIPVQIQPTDSFDFRSAIDAPSGDFVELNHRDSVQEVGLKTDCDAHKAELALRLLETHRNVDVHRAITRAVRLPKHADSGRQWSLVVNTEIEGGRRVVILRSMVNVS